jgi:hypothetical protein
MKNKLIIKLSLMIILFSSFTSEVRAGEPCAHLLICCRDCNLGVKFLVNGQWTADHNYSDIDTVRDILQKIKDAGITTVIIDMTNRHQWLSGWDNSENFKGKVDNVEQVCGEKGMKFFILLGNVWSDTAMEPIGLPSDADFMEAWNIMAQKVWDLWAQKPTYKKYGYGDDRPMLLTFGPAEDFWPKYNAAPSSWKTGFSKFYIGTNLVNVDKIIGETDGWGYRNSVGNPSGTIRYTSPLGGLVPGPKITPEAFANEVEWVSQATHYSVYGSYDDTCDGIMWGIADTSLTTKDYNHYPNGDDPYVFYDIVKNQLNPTGSPESSFATPSNNQIFTPSDHIEVEVNASDDGAISNVELYLNNILVRQESLFPYQWGLAGQGDTELENMATGSHTLKAVATDDTGKKTETYINITVFADDGPPAAPGMPTAVGAPFSVDLSWPGNSEPDVASYNIYSGTASNAVDVLMVNVSGTNATVGPFFDGDTVWLAVTAVDIFDNESEKSEAVSAVVLPSPPIILFADSFNREDADCLDASVVGMTGTIIYGVGTTYTVGSFYPSKQTALINNQASVAERGTVLLHHNFTNDIILTSREIEYSVDLSALFNAGINTRYNGLAIGLSEAEVTDMFRTVVPLSSLYVGMYSGSIGGNRLQVMANGVEVFTYPLAMADFNPATLTLRVRPTDFNAGSSVDFDVDFNVGQGGANATNILYSGSFLWEETDQNYLVFGAEGGDTPNFDNLSITTAIVQPYIVWATDNSLSGLAAEYTADSDRDGVNNLVEYALGGNPNTNDVADILPIYSMTEANGTNWFNVVYHRRLDATARNLTYEVQSSTNLVSNSWTNHTEEAGFTTLNADFESVTNRVPMDEKPQQFLRIKIDISE